MPTTIPAALPFKPKDSPITVIKLKTDAPVTAAIGITLFNSLATFCSLRPIKVIPWSLNSKATSRAEEPEIACHLSANPNTSNQYKGRIGDEG